ncbi:helix-turn-helix transcriptional regulator [Salipiger sp.]|uniref:helix-turn-helix transcriptional regulator n=1 Tax=Salipiger sp. TaxID=2078585 RepID=UPI003A97C83C
MNADQDKLTERSTPLVALIAVQVFCAAFFVWDVAGDAVELGWPPLDAEFVVETSVALCLIAAMVVETRVLMSLLRRKAHLERQLSLAAGAFHDIAEAQFRQWGLTPSEQDVAMLMLKGMSIPEIARIRGSAEGTVKSHLNGIYRKAGVTGRGAFLSLFIEDLMAAAPAVPATPAEPPAVAAQGR